MSKTGYYGAAPEDLIVLISQHHHSYDSDCCVDFGCSCGDIKDYDETDVSPAEHLAQVLTENGYHK